MHYSKSRIATHRLGLFLKNRVPRIVRMFVSPLYETLLYISTVSSKIAIEDYTRLGTNIRLSSLGCIIIGAIEIGDNTKIHHNVTIGVGLGAHSKEKFPSIGKNVWIGPNTVIHGGIVVGDGATILGGTILSRSIPPMSLVSGNPPKLIRSKTDNSKLLDSDFYNVRQGNYAEWVSWSSTLDEIS